MTKGRMEAFSDGVLAIVITIMVLELEVPHEPSLAALAEVAPTFFSYVLSFVFLGIYWNNHHHMLHAVHKVNGRVLWANLHLLFWLSLVPFVTAWVGQTWVSQTGFAELPIALYGVVFWMAGLAYFFLARALIAQEGPDSALAQAERGGRKEMISLALYTLAIPLAFVNSWLAFALYVATAAMWFIPDQRIERVLSE